MMARSLRFARRCSWLTIISLVPILLLAGCRSTSGSKKNSGGCCGEGGGGGGGCCRGASPHNPPAAAAPISSPVVDFSSAAPASRSDSVAANAAPASSLPSQSPYGGQKACPVTGHELGSMGTAIPVTVNGQTIYVCCRGCVAKAQANPDFYLRKVQAERGQQSQGTSSQSNSSSQSFGGSGGRSDSVAANASPVSSLSTQSPYGGQTICPVTGAPLGSMGTPIPVTVKGQTIYVCCQGCVAKVQRDPDGYLRKVQAEREGKSQGTSSPSNSSSGSCCGHGGGGGCCGHGGGGGCCGH